MNRSYAADMHQGRAEIEGDDELISRRKRCLHVAVVDEELPYPANSGKRIRTLSLLVRLARRHRVVLITHRNLDAAEVEPATAYLNSQGIEVIVVDRAAPPRSVQSRSPRFYAGLAANLLSPRPYIVDANYSLALREVVQRYERDHDVDLWQCEWTPYAEVLRDIDAHRKVIMAHNIESLIWQRYHETESNFLKRWYIKRQCDKFERFESRVFREVSSVVSVSEADAALAREIFTAPRLSVVENGVDLDYFLPRPGPRDHRLILYVGSLDWRPNLDAVNLLRQQIFPQILAKEPGARLCIVGRNPPDALVRETARESSIELHADVPDVRPFLARCGVLAVPLRIGGGSRLKILEALAMAAPVVSTRIGAEGLRLVPGRDLTIVESPEDMAESVLECIRNHKAACDQADRGRLTVSANYGWDRLADELEKIWCRGI